MKRTVLVAGILVLTMALAQPVGVAEGVRAADVPHPGKRVVAPVMQKKDPAKTVPVVPHPGKRIVDQLPVEPRTKVDDGGIRPRIFIDEGGIQPRVIDEGGIHPRVIDEGGLYPVGRAVSPVPTRRQMDDVRKDLRAKRLNSADKPQVRAGDRWRNLGQ